MTNSNFNQIERRVAPFWRGLNDFNESWAEHQLIAAARGMDIPPPDEVPPELEYRPRPRTPSDAKSVQNLMVPITSRSQSYQSDSSANLTPHTPAFSMPSTSPLSSPTSPLFRTRAKTLAVLGGSRNNSNADITPKEMQMPKDPFVNGQPIEVYLYKDAAECPICFLYYPPYLNRTRCCDQPICSECFVQIKRPDPHPPEHEVNDPNAPPDPERALQEDGQLVSEPSACPFCVQPEFGVTYAPPPFRRGLTYLGGGNALANHGSPMSSSSSLASGNLPQTGRRRATSLSATAPGVITTDRVRPDWATKLANARAHAARRAAAATALHTAAYFIGSNSNNQQESGGRESRRRSIMRRATGGSGTESPASTTTTSGPLHTLALLSERSPGNNEPERAQTPPDNGIAPPRNSSRRSRMEDLENMMMMEAIRLSIASEEDRRRKEEKDAKKENKRKEKENKKAEKAARKSGLYQTLSNTSANSSTSGWSGPSVSSSALPDTNVDPTGSSKGKGADRTAEATSTSQAPIAIPIANSSKFATDDPSLPVASSSSSSNQPPRSSHLRHMSTASSSASSILPPVNETPGDESDDSTPRDEALEPMFNFRSLAAMIGEDDIEGSNEKSGASHVEHVETVASAAGSNAALPLQAKPNGNGNAVEEQAGSSKDVPQASQEVSEKSNSNGAETVVGKALENGNGHENGVHMPEVKVEEPANTAAPATSIAPESTSTPTLKSPIETKEPEIENSNGQSNGSGNGKILAENDKLQAEAK